MQRSQNWWQGVGVGRRRVRLRIRQPLKLELSGTWETSSPQCPHCTPMMLYAEEHQGGHKTWTVVLAPFPYLFTVVPSWVH